VDGGDRIQLFWIERVVIAALAGWDAIRSAPLPGAEPGLPGGVFFVDYFACYVAFAWAREAATISAAVALERGAEGST